MIGEYGRSNSSLKTRLQLGLKGNEGTKVPALASLSFFLLSSPARLNQRAGSLSRE